ncbi:MAG: porin [Hyphomicrobiaceae bacterium]
MFGGLLKSTSRLALVAAAAVVGGVSAQAADLGGNCCADLEERVAELEATTARKGNRKVSLTVYGQVNKAIVWHNSDRADAYRPGQMTVRDNTNSVSRFGFRGDAKITSDLTASYLIEVGIAENFGRNTSGQDNVETDSGAFFQIRHNVVRLQSKSLGTIALGQTSVSTDGAFEVNLAAVNGINPAGDADEGHRFLGAAFDSFANGIDGSRRQGIYYTSPTLAGFVFSAGYGHKDQDARGADVAVRANNCQAGTSAFTCDSDEFWDVALRYAGEFNGIRIAAAVGYRKENDTQNLVTGAAGSAGVDAEAFMTSGSVMHVPTGLYMSGGYGTYDFDEQSRDRDAFWIQGGIQRNFFGIGNTILYAEYGEVNYDTAISAAGVDTGLNNAARRDGNWFGLGVNQYIAAASADIYLNYRRYEVDAIGPNQVGSNRGTDADVVMGGMRIQF